MLSGSEQLAAIRERETAASSLQESLVLTGLRSSALSSRYHSLGHLNLSVASRTTACVAIALLLLLAIGVDGVGSDLLFLLRHPPW